MPWFLAAWRLLPGQVLTILNVVPMHAPCTVLALLQLAPRYCSLPARACVQGGRRLLACTLGFSNSQSKFARRSSLASLAQPAPVHLATGRPQARRDSPDPASRCSKNPTRAPGAPNTCCPRTNVATTRPHSGRPAYGVSGCRWCRRAGEVSASASGSHTCAAAAAPRQAPRRPAHGQAACRGEGDPADTGRSCLCRWPPLPLAPHKRAGRHGS